MQVQQHCSEHSTGFQWRLGSNKKKLLVSVFRVSIRTICHLFLTFFIHTVPFFFLPNMKTFQVRVYLGKKRLVTIYNCTPDRIFVIRGGGGTTQTTEIALKLETNQRDNNRHIWEWHTLMRLDQRTITSTSKGSHQTKQMWVVEWPHWANDWSELTSWWCFTCLVNRHGYLKAMPTKAFPVKKGLLLFVGYLTSQQHASASQGRICSDNFTCCHTEIEIADQTLYLT